MDETKPLPKPTISTDKRPFLECFVEFMDSTSGRDKVKLNRKKVLQTDSVHN
jgi:hypothetical protein